MVNCLFNILHTFWIGFTLNDTIYQILVARFASTDLTIDFDDFVACLMKLELMFRKYSPEFCNEKINQPYML